MKVVLFPQTKRVGRIRDVAVKLLDKSTDRHAAYYRDQVTTAFWTQFDRAGIPEDRQHDELTAFWQAVRCEMIRLGQSGYSSGDAA